MATIFNLNAGKVWSGGKSLSLGLGQSVTIPVGKAWEGIAVGTNGNIINFTFGPPGTRGQLWAIGVVGGQYYYFITLNEGDSIDNIVGPTNPSGVILVYSEFSTVDINAL